MTEPVSVGLAVARSGRYAPLGRQVLAGVECWVADVNATGGIAPGGGARRPVVLQVIDDESDEQVLAARLGGLLERTPVDLLLGPYGSGLTLAASRVADAHGQVLFNHSGSADRIFTQGFRRHVGIISPASGYFVGAFDALRAAAPQARRVALFSAASGFPEAVAAGLTARVAAAGCELVAHERYAPDCDDFRARLRVLGEVDWLFGVGRLEDDLRLAEQIAELGPAPAAQVFVAAGVDRFGAALGHMAEGCLGPSQWEAQARGGWDVGPGPQAFAERYRAQTGAAPDYPAAQGYAGGLVAQRCAETAVSLAPDAVYAAACGARFRTLYGAFAIDPGTGRQQAHQMLVTQWQDGRRVIVAPAECANGTLRYAPRATD